MDGQLSPRDQWESRSKLPHYIYALIDPRDGVIRYIGCSHDVEKRLRQHLRNPLNCLRGWIKELKVAGLVPETKVLERLGRGGCGALWREADVIAEYAGKLGAQLLNSYGRVNREVLIEKRDREREERWESRRGRQKMRRAMRSILAPVKKHPNHPPRIIEHKGLRLNMSQWAKRLGLSRERVRQRINKFPVEVALRPRQE